jgi:hypothetical protein
VVQSFAHQVASPHPTVEANLDSSPPTVVFRVPEVRPVETIVLPPFFVLGGNNEDLRQVRGFKWTHTTRSHDGDATGVIRYQVAANPVDHSNAVWLDRFADDE